MKLESLAKLVPGATVRVRLRKGKCIVNLQHEGRVGEGIHPELTFATRNAVMALRSPA